MMPTMPICTPLAKAHLGGADRMENGGADVAGGPGERGLVVADAGARQVFLRPEAL